MVAAAVIMTPVNVTTIQIFTEIDDELESVSILPTSPRPSFFSSILYLLVKRLIQVNEWIYARCMGLSMLAY